MRMPSQKLYSLQKVAGVGMIEILVSLFVLTIGLLGVASLQFTGTFNNVQAASRSQAELVARYVSEQMVSAAQPAESDDGWDIDDAFFNTDFFNFETLTCNDSNLYQCYCLTLPATVPNCRTGNCTSAEIAEYSGWEASCQAVGSNPNMRISVSCNDRNNGDAKACTSGSLINIAVSWPVKSDQQATVANDSRCTFNSDSNRACVIKEVTL